MRRFPPIRPLFPSIGHDIGARIADGEARKGLDFDVLWRPIEIRVNFRRVGLVHDRFRQLVVEFLDQIRVGAEFGDIIAHIEENRFVEAVEHLNLLQQRLVERVMLVDLLHHGGEIVHLTAVDGGNRTAGCAIT